MTTADIEIEDPPKADMDQARKNVIFALNNFKEGNFGLDHTVNRIMEMYIGAYRQGQEHKKGFCDFCKMPTSAHLTCSGCNNLIHGIYFLGRQCMGETLYFHHDMCVTTWREKMKNG